MTISVEYLDKCIKALETGVKYLEQGTDKELYELHRAGCIKEFELILEQSGSLLRKRIRGYFATNKQADNLTFKDVFRHAAKHDLIDSEACKRWMKYRDNRNDTSHNYGEKFANETLKLLPVFIEDAKSLSKIIGEQEK